MSRFRLVILDNMKEQLDNPHAQKIMADMLFSKQKNFLRTDPRYVVMDKHDMIGTHYAIYDTENMLQPKMVFAIRTTFLHRAQEHYLDTPLISLLPHLTDKHREVFKSFQNRHKELVDCNAWFVDPTFSKKNSGLNLSDLGYFMVCMHVMRCGYTNIIGCTNETYNASRWLAQIGDDAAGLMFEHPTIKVPHKMMMMENFNLEHFARVYQENEELIKDLMEVLPEAGKALPSFVEFSQSLLAPYITRRASAA